MSIEKLSKSEMTVLESTGFEQAVYKAVGFECHKCDRCRRLVPVDTHIYWPSDKLCFHCVSQLLSMICEYPPYKIVNGERIYISELEAFSK